MDNQQILNGPIYRVTFKYILFNILSMTGLSLYVLADTFFIANGIGSTGLVALNLVIPAYSFVNGLGLLLGIGGGTMFSIARGRGDQAACNRIFTQTAVIGLIVGLLLTTAGLLFARPIAILLGADENTVELAVSYLRMLLTFSVAFVLNNIFVCFVRNDSAPKLAMTAMLAGSLTNIVLDYLMIYPLKMGMAGAALATGLAPVVGLAVCSTHILRKKNHFVPVRCKPSGKEIRGLLGAGVPSFVNEFSSGIVIFLFNMVILSTAGDMGVAAYGITANVALVCVAIFTGIAQGIQPVVSVSYGAGKRENIHKILRIGLIAGVLFGIVFCLVGQLFPAQISAVFVDSSDRELMKLAVRSIRLYFLAFPLMGMNILLISYFASVAQAKPSVTVSSLRGFAAVIPLLLILPRFLELDGVWLTVPGAELAAFAVAIFFIRRSGSQLGQR